MEFIDLADVANSCLHISLASITAHLFTSAMIVFQLVRLGLVQLGRCFDLKTGFKKINMSFGARLSMGI